MHHCRWIGIAILLVLNSAASQEAVRAGSITVAGTSNIFGAGHAPPNDTPAPGGGGGGTPPPYISLNGATSISFSAITGEISVNVGVGFSGPDGVSFGPWSVGSYNGISGVRLDCTQALLGVFVGASEPTDPAPPQLDFVGDTSFTSLSPAIDQTFFIGDGLTGTGSGSIQQFIAPAGATRLYFGIQDGPGLPGYYNDNEGAFQVQYNLASVPEPASLVLLGLGSLLVAALRWRTASVA